MELWLAGVEAVILRQQSEASKRGNRILFEDHRLVGITAILFVHREYLATAVGYAVQKRFVWTASASTRVLNILR